MKKLGEYSISENLRICDVCKKSDGDIIQKTQTIGSFWEDWEGNIYCEDCKETNQMKEEIFG